MNKETKLKIKNCFKEMSGRDAKPHELINAEKDVGLIVPILVEKIEELELRIKKLEK